MTLYTEPPTGSISFQKLESFALKRLDFLLKVRTARGDLTKLHEIVCEPANVTDSDCLIVGSLKDKVSHFILRLLMGGDPETQQFFREAETAWFDFKFSCLTEDEMSKFFHSVDKTLKKTNVHNQSLKVAPGGENIASILGVLRSIKQSVGSWREVISLYMTQSCTSQFSVPFHCVLNLVKIRQVMLDRGMARVSFSRLREVVTEQFSSLMRLASAQASQQFPAAVADERLRLLWRKMKHIYRIQNLAPPGVGLVPGLSLDQVDSMAVHFPLCMSSLLRSLRQKHRLGHHARIQLTLFLKDLGLPVHHALALWQQEYSRPTGPGACCAHSWQTDGRRYTYSIRHLYGLEGARRNYLGHCCDSLQQRAVGCGEEGGCPFSHWDDNSLSVELSTLGLTTENIVNILTLRGKGLPSAACYHSLRVTRSKTKQKGSVCNRRSDHQPELGVQAQACHQVSISSSPDSLHRDDCSGNQVCDVEDLLEPNRVKSGEKTRLALGKHCGLGMTVTVAEQKHSVRPLATESACGSGHYCGRGTDVCGHTTSTQFSPRLKQCELSSDAALSCVKKSDEHLKAKKDHCHVETESQRAQCFDHEVCPSQATQSQDVGDPASSTKASDCPVIFRPVHYVQVSYQSLLEGLKL